MFLSCLNEISGGCEKILPVSESFFKYMVVRVKCEGEWNSIITFLLRRL